MRKLALILLLSGAANAQPPQTPRGNQSRTYHGLRVADPYRWLEQAQDARVKSWIEAQNSYAEKCLAAYPGREALARRIQQLALTAPTRTTPQLAGATLLFMKDSPPSPQPVLVGQAWPGGAEKVLVDSNADANPSAITDFWPSPSGKYVAYGTAVGGSELSTVFVVETATGRKLPDVLRNAAGGTTPPSLAWDADEKGVTYVRLPQHSLFNASLYHHRLGTDQGQDAPAFGQGLSRVAEWELTTSQDGRQAAALVHFGDGAPLQLAFRTAGGWRLVSSGSSDIRGGGRWIGHQLLTVNYRKAPRGEVRLTDSEGRSRILIPQSQWAVKEAYPIRGGVLVARVWGAQQRLEHWSSAGSLVRVVALPESGIGLGTVASSSDSADALITYRGWTVPERWVSYNAVSGELKTVFELAPVGDYSAIVATPGEAVSRDGTRVPVTILHHRAVTPNGQRPTILYAYGGFGVIQQPNFLGATLAWLERGGVYAVANIRGGGEFGEPWHQAGMRHHKQNCFDDFYAAALALHESGWTRPDRLGIMGGSNGGLLVAASLVQHPQAFRAVVGLVGVYDSLGHELFPNGTYNIPEYGDTKVKADFDSMLAYSPLQNVKPATPYPAVLLQTGENDLRVAPWQTRKLGAALQSSTSSGRPVLVLTQTNAGHGAGASFSQKVGKTALALSFFAQQLGLPETVLKD
ncbi:MAG: prolyl oligopeptidase family serine peptidase [Vulcanimicrobiota bacterium]